MNNNKLYKDITSIFLSSGNILIGSGIIIGLTLIYYFSFSSIIVLGIAILPLLIIFLLLMIKYNHRIFYLLFISHFLFLFISSFTDLRIGVLTLTFNITAALLIAVISIYKKTDWKESKNGMLILYSIWGIYCIAELANPNNVQEAWNIAITYYAIYPILCAILVPVTLQHYKNIEWILVIWSIFVIIASAKGFYQKHYGFTPKELIFLFEKGGAKTHIIWSGIRYFSFFTDAANFGVHMGMATICFGISAFFIRNKWLKIYFYIVVLVAIYGMFISGTRSAIVVPLGGLFVFIFISKNWKAFFLSTFTLLVILVFFQYTTIGADNQYVRKMRSAFNPKQDASYMLRVYNKDLMKDYMLYKPFGYGLGLGGKAERFHPKELMPIPPDSWLVNVWTDTGIVGLTLYLILHTLLFAWCFWILMFRLSNIILRNLLTAWLCMNAGFFVASYTNDVMQYPNIILIYLGFAICFLGPVIEKNELIIENKPQNNE